MRKCDCCGSTEDYVGVAAIPGLPVSIGWCRRCLMAGVIPLWAASANTAMIGGLEHANAAWQELVKATLDYFGKTDAEFAALVAEDMKTLPE